MSDPKRCARLTGWIRHRWGIWLTVLLPIWSFGKERILSSWSVPEVLHPLVSYSVHALFATACLIGTWAWLSRSARLAPYLKPIPIRAFVGSWLCLWATWATLYACLAGLEGFELYSRKALAEPRQVIRQFREGGMLADSTSRLIDRLTSGTEARHVGMDSLRKRLGGTGLPAADNLYVAVDKLALHKLISHVVLAIANLCNNLQSLFLALCCGALLVYPVGSLFYLALTLPWLVVVLFGAELGLVFLWPSVEPWRWSALLSGILASVALGMLSARLQTKPVAAPSATVILLFGYAAIQPAWGIFWEHSDVRYVLTAIALPLKLLLFVTITWTLDSGLLWYLLDTNSTEVDETAKGEVGQFVSDFMSGRSAKLAGWARQ